MSHERDFREARSPFSSGERAVMVKETNRSGSLYTRPIECTCKSIIIQLFTNK